ncbi:MAG: response regulator [Bacteroidetes bacterium]|nr:response regulator [Bacteroidota bacterium]
MPKRILAVEHKQVLATHITRLLVGRGHEITYCGNDGHKVLEMVSHNPPDLILTSLYLKGPMNGIELIDRLWVRWEIPVVVISGPDPSDLPAAWQDRPEFFFLGKPFLPGQLCDIIEKALQQANP